MKYFMRIGYLPHGLPKVYAELGEVVCGAKVGRESDAENIMDMNIGMAVEDMPVAKELYQRALKRGIGMKLSL
jgi:ornithine cyclodeaminase/alanine dehydrogenase